MSREVVDSFSVRGIAPEGSSLAIAFTHMLTHAKSTFTMPLQPGNYTIPSQFAPLQVTVPEGRKVDLTFEAIAESTGNHRNLTMRPFSMRFSQPIVVNNPASGTRPFSGFFGPLLNWIGDKTTSLYIDRIGFNAQGQFEADGNLAVGRMFSVPLPPLVDPLDYPQIHLDSDHLSNGEFIKKPQQRGRAVLPAEMLAATWPMVHSGQFAMSADLDLPEDLQINSQLGDAAINGGPMVARMHGDFALREMGEMDLHFHHDQADEPSIRNANIQASIAGDMRADMRGNATGTLSVQADMIDIVSHPSAKAPLALPVQSMRSQNHPGKPALIGAVHVNMKHYTVTPSAELRLDMRHSMTLPETIILGGLKVALSKRTMQIDTEAAFHLNEDQSIEISDLNMRIDDDLHA